MNLIIKKKHYICEKYKESLKMQKNFRQYFKIAIDKFYS